MKRIVWHWTAGTHHPSDYEKTRYHFLIDGNGNVHDGDQPPEANYVRPGGSLKPNYVRHAGGFNSNSIGISVCAMSGAREHPPREGPYPVTAAQLDSLVKKTAELCRIYNIKPHRNTTLMHSEVLPRFGAGIYKWDINLFDGKMWKPTEAGDFIRSRVVTEMRQETHRRPPKWQRWLRRWFRI